MSKDHAHNWYKFNTDIREGSLWEVQVTPKPRWAIINEARKAIEDLWCPDRFIEQSRNSLDFARL